MRDVRLLSSSLQLANFQSPDSPMRYKIELEPSVERGSSEDDSFIVRCSYQVTIDAVTDEDAEDGVRVADILCEFGALYTLDLDEDESASDEELAAFSESSGQLGLWPYAREYVQSATSRLGLPALTIGMFKISLTKDEAQSTSAEIN